MHKQISSATRCFLVLYGFNALRVHLLLSIMERANAHARNVATIMFTYEDHRSPPLASWICVIALLTLHAMQDHRLYCLLNLFFFLLSMSVLYIYNYVKLYKKYIWKLCNYICIVNAIILLITLKLKRTLRNYKEAWFSIQKGIEIYYSII